VRASVLERPEAQGAGTRCPRTRADSVVTGAGELLTCDPSRPGLGIVPGGAVAAYQGRVCWTGPAADLDEHVSLVPGARVIEAAGRVVMPGIVECHSHLVFGGDRAHEFQLRVQGHSYEHIAAAGGGIMSTVRATRAASRDELVERGSRHLDRLLAFGVTTVEAKSGYGLTTEDELRLLEITREVSESHPATVVPTFLGAHSVPTEYAHDPDAYVELVVDEMIPRAAETGLARFCDVFCETVAFSPAQSRRVLEAGLAHGLRPKIHADQLSDGGGALLAAELGAVSAEHLDHVSPKGAAALADAGVTAVLLPGAVFFLGSTAYAPARGLMEEGVTVALSTDLNPGTCYSENPFLMGTIASCYMGMTAEEVLLGLTRNAARALGMENEVGSLSPGKQADILVLDTDDHLMLPYHFGINPVAVVLKGGRVVVGEAEVGP
jgi:imidazolonepropionase